MMLIFISCLLTITIQTLDAEDVGDVSNDLNLLRAEVIQCDGEQGPDEGVELGGGDVREDDEAVLQGPGVEVEAGEQ